MITLAETLRGYDPKAGRPVPVVRIYAANIISPREAELRLKRQKLEFVRSRKAAMDELRRDLERIAAGDEPSWACANGVPPSVSQLGQQAMGFPPMGAGKHAAAGGPAAGNTEIS